MQIFTKLDCRSARRSFSIVVCFAACLWGRISYSAPSAEPSQAKSILDATAVKGGLIVHLGCGDGKLTAALRAHDGLQVHGLDRDAKHVKQAREHVRSLGVYGEVAVDQLRGDSLPYIDNLVNLLVSEDLGGVPMEEVNRVLAPGGVAYVKHDGQWQQTRKSRPAAIDEWTHFMHDSTGNAVAHDSVVGPPRRLQWIGSPRWSRHHDRMASMSALVSTGGRIFYIMDEGSRVSIQLPADWKLVARDAFNGTVLWKRSIDKWHSHLWPLKSGPTQLARRLVAVDDRVYVTLGIKAPLTAMDAATGETIHTYEKTAGTEEIIVAGDIVYALVNPGAAELDDYHPKHNVGDQRRVATEFVWNEKPRVLRAFDSETGRLRWQRESRVVPLTLAADSQRVYFHDGEKVVSLDRVSGEVAWSSPPAARRKAVPFNFGPKVVVYEDIVLFAGGDRKMTALNAASGKELWTAPHARGAYQSPEDLLVVSGLVWSAPTMSTGDSGVWTGRDVRTGELKREFPPDVTTYWFHHRCHMAKATDRFLLPSRTGIEFVDYESKHWDINHWVRGGCLYGIMPCNGLVYAPPHNCACYPEAKLFGLNALAPAAESRAAAARDDLPVRLVRGPAFGQVFEATSADGAADWPTYRHDAARSGFTGMLVKGPLEPAWQSKIGGKLSAPTISGGKLFVAETSQHRVHALDASTGTPIWSFTAGGRIDSPPTIYGGRAYFGSADGWVYCLSAADGEVVWRFQGAPRDQRLTAFEQLESVWPVHGSVLVQDDIVTFLAGRSNYLDGGLRLYRLEAATGRKLSETVIDESDPETGANVQERLRVLNMPAGLPDILSSDGEYLYMRSQKFDLSGNRISLGPHSGEPAAQGSVQRGEGAHLFAPMGFLDDTWFHRSYWVYGRSFAGGHGGYYQAGRYAPSGRILVHDNESVYGFGRKPQYYRWTTTIEHQLFASSKQPPDEARASVDEASKRIGPGRRNTGMTFVQFDNTKSLDPTGKPLAVEAFVKTDRPEGVVVARGGPAQGFALVVRGGKPRFVIRADEKVAAVSAKQNIVGRWVHLVGVLTVDKKLKLFVDGKLAANGEAPGMIGADPVQGLAIGADDQTAVGEYKSPLVFTGLIDEVKIYYGAVTDAEVAARFDDPGNSVPQAAKLVLACSFDKGNAADSSGNQNHGKAQGTAVVKGKYGSALRFVAKAPAASRGSFVQHRWTRDIPLLARAMVLAGKTLIVAGPPDLIDEEQTFQRLVARDESVQEQLVKQQAALDGKSGAILMAVSAADGSELAKLKLPSLPAWDGLAAAEGKLFLVTTDGEIVAFQAGR